MKIARPSTTTPTNSVPPTAAIITMNGFAVRKYHVIAPNDNHGAQINYYT